MIEEILYDFLNDSEELDAPVYTMIPKNAPDEYYVFEQTGSSQTEHINLSTIAIRSCAPSLVRAVEMAYELDDVMLSSLLSLDYISKVQRNTISNFTDPSTKTYRYQGVYVITHY